MSVQMIFQRYETKYMITRRQREAILAAASEYLCADEHGRSMVCSVYLDTPDYLLIRRSLEHPLYKEKLRLRSYGVAQAGSTVFAELKKKYNSVVYKRRIALTKADSGRFLLSHRSETDTQISRELEYCMMRYQSLAPRIFLSCEREAFCGTYDRELRITFDRNILWRDTDIDLAAGIYGAPLLHEEEILMEVKTAGAMPLWLAGILSELCIYKTSFSKYGAVYQTGGIHHV